MNRDIIDLIIIFLHHLSLIGILALVVHKVVKSYNDRHMVNNIVHPIMLLLDDVIDKKIKDAIKKKDEK